MYEIQSVGACACKCGQKLTKITFETLPVVLGKKDEIFVSSVWCLVYTLAELCCSNRMSYI